MVRHGDTEWASAGRHTGRTDVPLTDAGRDQARMLGRRLASHPFAMVLSSPLSRAFETATLAGFGEVVIGDPDLMEWDYGRFEGLTTARIRERVPDWSIWRGPWPGGETIDAVSTRVDRVLALVQDEPGDALLFAHGHLLRMVAARWLGLPPASGGLFGLGTATISVLGWDRGGRVIETWNEACRE
jgi:broad specificity phosphatase PhoE